MKDKLRVLNIDPVFANALIVLEQNMDSKNIISLLFSSEALWIYIQ